jgi:regulator of protease activity HflC (stomatin/prohibitin superfamily)
MRTPRLGAINWETLWRIISRGLRKIPPSRLERASRYYLGLFGVFVLVHMATLTTVAVGTVGVRYDNAFGLYKADLAPGYHLELLGLQRVWRLPSGYLAIDFIDADSLNIRTKDNNTVNVDVSIPYRIKPNEAWRIMDAGNHLLEGPERLRFQRFAEDTATDVLRGQLAQLKSEDFYNTARRLAVASDALTVLNNKLARYHLEASRVLIRATHFRPEYETQLATIQLNAQHKLLDGAKRAVAMRQQSLDNFAQQTNAMVSAKEQDWAKRIAQLDRAYQVGLVDTGEDRSPGVARRRLAAKSQKEASELVQQAADLFGQSQARITDGHLLGIKNIEAETTEYSRRVVAVADAISARLSAEGEAKVATITGNYEGRVNQLLNSPAGRAYVAYNAAGAVTFSPDLSFQSGEGLPSVLRLGDFARGFMGR